MSRSRLCKRVFLVLPDREVPRHRDGQPARRRAACGVGRLDPDRVDASIALDRALGAKQHVVRVDDLANPARSGPPGPGHAAARRPAHRSSPSATSSPDRRSRRRCSRSSPAPSGGSGSSSTLPACGRPVIAGGAFDAITVAPAALFAAIRIGSGGRRRARCSRIADPSGAAQLRAATIVIDLRLRLDASDRERRRRGARRAAAHAAAGRRAGNQRERRRQGVADDRRSAPATARRWSR